MILKHFQIENNKRKQTNKLMSVLSSVSQQVMLVKLL